MNIALVQLNPTLGALRANADAILRHARTAAEHGAEVIAFPELALTGAPLYDLAHDHSFLCAVERELARLAAELPQAPVIIVHAPSANRDTPKQNHTASIFQNGARRECGLLEIGTTRLAIQIGARPDPAALAHHRGRIAALLNLAAAPFRYGGQREREAALRDLSRTVAAPTLFCNLVGGQDEFVFEGASAAIDETSICARAKSFEEDILYFALPETSNDWKNASEGLPTIGSFRARGSDTLHASASIWSRPRVESPHGEADSIYAALVSGVRDYAGKNGFGGVVLGLSGGLDSALVAAIAVDALGADRVHGITMPSRYTSSGTLSDSHAIAKNLGIQLFEQPIQSLYEAFLNELTPLWPGRAPDTTEENLQPRIRGILAMALSNKFGWLLLNTGNKSELATGYCTLYGDMCGGFAPLRDVSKTRAYQLARWRNRHGEVIPESTIARAPSAELKENQTDQDSLPPYDVLDGIIERYIERDFAPEQVVADGFDAAIVARVVQLIRANEFKRGQGAIGPAITAKAFGTDRRMPITNRYRE